MSKKPLSLLGCGGHGWLNCTELVQNWNAPVYAWFATVDWGGFTGVWGRMCEHDNGYFAHQLYPKGFSNVPWGDINKAVAYFISASQHSQADSLSKTWILRHSSYNSMLASWQYFAKHISLSSALQADFEEYLKLSWQFLHTFLHKTNSQLGSGASLAHFFSPWLLSRFGSMFRYNRWFKQQKFLPTKVFLYFTHTHRTVLQATSIHGQILHGEDVIDQHPDPLNPESFLVQGSFNSKKPEYCRDFIAKLKKSVIVIPTGSVANWLALLSNKKVCAILQAKSGKNQFASFHSKKEAFSYDFIWIPNAASSPQDVGTINYLNYFHQQMLYPQILLTATTDDFFSLPKLPTVTVISADYSAGFATPHKTQIADYVLANHS